MKKLLAILLVVATLFCIVACGDNTDTTTTTAGTTTTTKQDDATTTTVGDETNTTTVNGEETTTVADDDTTTTTEKKDDATTTTTKKEETTKAPGLKGVNPADSNNWKKVVNGVFTSDKGGIQIMAEGWKTYGLYSISYVPEAYQNVGQTNAVCVSVYDADPADVFAAKTKADFEEVLMVGLDSFSATTVCGYPAYKAVATDTYYVWVINTPTHKYFINFMQAPLDNGGYPFAAEAAQFMETVVVYK